MAHYLDNYPEEMRAAERLVREIFPEAIAGLPVYKEELDICKKNKAKKRAEKASKKQIDMF